MAKRKRKPANRGANDGVSMGRPKIEFDYDRLERLAEIQCTQLEMAGYFKISIETLSYKIREKYQCTFLEFMKTYGSNGLVMLREAQLNKAIVEGNPQMQIWLGKQYLNQSDHVNTYDNNDRVIKLAYNTQPKVLNGTTNAINEADSERGPQELPVGSSEVDELPDEQGGRDS